MHQGKFIQNRSMDSILQEAQRIAKHPQFKGTIPDVGAPSANMYGLRGVEEKACRVCRRASCLYPEACANLDTDQSPSVELWRQLRKIEGLKHIFVSSGVRYDLLLKDTSGQYLKDLCSYHVGGQLKIAPEHVADKVTRYMRKPGKATYKKFIRAFQEVNKQIGKEQYIIPYFISAHPGCDLKDTIELAEFVRDKLQYYPEQVQNFTPTPMTISTCMYYTGIDPYSGKALYVPRGNKERRWQRALLQYRNPDNRALIREALLAAGREDLIGFSGRSLVRGEKQPPANKRAINKRADARKKH